MKKEVEVTLEDVQNGIRSNCCYCPVVLAMKRAGFLDAKVGNFTATWYEDGQEKTCLLPWSVQELIIGFDMGGAKFVERMLPLKFSLMYM
jgi:hypothetical protein